MYHYGCIGLLKNNTFKLKNNKYKFSGNNFFGIECGCYKWYHYLSKYDKTIVSNNLIKLEKSINTSSILVKDIINHNLI